LKYLTACIYAAILKTLEKTYRKQPGSCKENMFSTATNILSHLAFKHAAQANIVFTFSNGKIVLVNIAARKLLGYSNKELLLQNAASIFGIKKERFKKMLKQAARGQSVAAVRVIKKSGKTIPCKIISAVFIDADGIEKVISTITDMSPGLLKQKNIDIKRNKIVTDNIALAKSKQKNIDIMKEGIVARNIEQAKSKQKGIDARKEKIVAHNTVLAKTKQKKIDSKKDKIVADNIVRALKKSGQEKRQQEIAGKTGYEESLKIIFNSSSDVLFDFNLLTQEAIISDAYEKKFGYKTSYHMMPAGHAFTHIHPEDRQAFMKEYERVLASDETGWKYSFRFLRADDSVANVVNNSIILRDANGKACRMVGSVQDVSKQKVLEERLAQEIQLKEKQIAEATKDAKDTERADIGKELHDNINQLLGASRMYLDMAKRGGTNGEIYLSRSSEYTISAIEEIRKLTKGLATDTIKNLGLCTAIVNVTHDTMEINPVKISCSLDHFNENSVNDKFKLNIFRIVQEQLNNILKHAQATKVAINLLQNKKVIRLTISDNGIGFDTALESKGMGMVNIKSRAATYNGTADFVSKPGQGCVLQVSFPFAGGLLNKN
jgi:PAS domain S-box-containing protein